MTHKKSINQKRQRRIKRVRAKIFGTIKRPRLSVKRSNRHIYVQLIDDVSGHTLVSASSLKYDKKEKITKTEIAKLVGKDLAQKAKERGITQVVFDRRWYKYHGRIKALADAAREEGLKF